MGEVRRGVHEPTGTEVAVKVITTRFARGRTFLDALRHEIWAMARLDHAGIVAVLDHGEVTDEEADASAGLLVGGAPYLVMELVEGTTLRTLGHAGNWAAMRAVLLAILDALAHAHARGVVHRDVEPANVLFAGWSPQPHALRLADFGLAYALHSTEHSHALGAGTPWYMAPEQVLGNWRDQGAWTDLYAVGCLGYWLASGKPPYWQLGSDDARLAQVEAPRAPLEPAFDVPGALRGWLDAVLAKRPRDRFQTAADAARALRAIPADAVGARPWRPITATRGPAEPTIVGPPGASRSSMPPPPRIVPAAAPDDWRSDTTEVRAPDVLAAGLALHGLRSVPLAGRDEERDALWDMLREVVEQRDLRVVVIDGGPGVGKSRLAEWLETRALELGLAQVVHATHAPTPGPSDGLRAALRRHLGGEGLDRADTARQVLERIPALDA